jgi:hypothetical protein
VIKCDVTESVILGGWYRGVTVRVWEIKRKQVQSIFRLNKLSVPLRPMSVAPPIRPLRTGGGQGPPAVRSPPLIVVGGERFIGNFQQN